MTCVIPFFDFKTDARSSLHIRWSRDLPYLLTIGDGSLAAWTRTIRTKTRGEDRFAQSAGQSIDDRARNGQMHRAREGLLFIED